MSYSRYNTNMNNNAILLLSEFISFQSVSADPTRTEEMKETVSFLSDKLSSLGFEVWRSYKDGAPPLIIARKSVPGAVHTIGIYGHYDVQPEDPIAEWKTEPFTLSEKGGKLYGRGVADNKGHIIQNIAAVESLIQSGQLKNNVVFVLEGEEETGSEHLEDLLRKNIQKLQHVDVFYITDSGMYAKGIPQIEYALRGLVYCEILLTTGERDLHSGVYGNMAHNPANILSDLLSRMKDLKTGRISIPGFYDDVRTPDLLEMKLLEKTKTSDTDLIEEMKTYGIRTVDGVPAYLASKIQPSMDIHGFISGYTGEGPKTVIPRTARAKFSFRLVENQDPENILSEVKKFIKNTLPKSIKSQLTIFSKDTPFYTSLENEYIQKTAAIMSAHFGADTVFNRSGGSIPVAEIIQRILNKPVVITGFTLPDDNIHAPNENIDVDMFREGIECLKKLMNVD